MRAVEVLDSIGAWLGAPLWPPARRRYWATRARSHGLRRLGLATASTMADIQAAIRDRRPAPVATLRAMAERVRKDASAVGDPEMSALVSEWIATSDDLIRRWGLPGDREAMLSELRLASAKIAGHLADLLGVDVRADSDVIRSYPLRALLLDGVSVPFTSGRVVLYRYQSIVLWRIVADVPASAPDGGSAPRVAQASAAGEGDVQVSGRGIVTYESIGGERQLMVELEARPTVRYTGAAANRIRRGRLVGYSLLLPAAAGLLVSLSGPWQYRAAFEAGVIATLVLGGAAVVVLTLRHWATGSPAPTVDGRGSFVGRHPSLLLLGSLVFAVGGTVWAARDIGDWLTPPDRLSVTIDTVLNGFRGGNTEIFITGSRTIYRSPIFIGLTAHPGPAVIYIGHITHELLHVVQHGGAGEASEPAATPAPAPAALPSTPAFAPVLQTPPPGGVFYGPGAASALWFQVGSRVGLVLTGLDPTSGGGFCILPGLAVGSDQRYLSTNPTTAGACGSGTTDAPAERCRGALFVPTVIPVGQQGNLFVEIHTASGAMFGFASTQLSGDLPALDPALIGCT